ncbi:type VII secretion-associated serine protease mycosin [Actinoplanes sp. NPDC051494]|uniref:type VII secretion-associated serine protease mycosin n=1 Tax=Actinoplanes sp. NPDC051494 TaxID=3363907 RepID=UPI00378D88A3
MRPLKRLMIFGFVMATASALVGWPPVAAYADSIRDAQWHLDALAADRVHKISRGAGVTVALIDTGVSTDSPDLSDAVAAGTDLLPDPIGDGRDDINGHGTQMAGIIAGRGHGGGRGVLGIAPEAKILPIRSPINAITTHDYVTQAVIFAKQHGANVINMSFGGMDDTVLHNAIRDAKAADIVVVASSGNLDGPRGDYPGKYPEVLTVGASNQDGGIADFSQTGPQVDVVAPGVDIVTTGISGSGYYEGSGTSEATAVVSGAVALVRARFPELSADEVVHRITATARDAGKPGRDDEYGYGRLDVLRALTADVPAAAPSSASSSPDTSPPNGLGQQAGTERTSPLLVAGVAAGGVLLVGGLLVAFLVGRGRGRRR